MLVDKLMLEAQFLFVSIVKGSTCGADLKNQPKKKINILYTEVREDDYDITCVRHELSDSVTYFQHLH